MIENLTIKNFQSHKDTELTFSPGINAITGTSDSGKSAILRALKLLTNNRPRGIAFRTFDYLKPKGPTEVTLTIDKTVIKRIRDKNTNQYKLGKEVFDTVKSDVPEEVTQFLNLHETAVQGQHESYFLLQNSPGEVAKKLNKIANLEIIDFVLKSVNSNINENNREIKRTKIMIEQSEEEIAEFEHLDEVEKIINSLTENIEIFNETEQTIGEIEDTLLLIERTTKDIQDINDWLEITTDFDPLVILCADLKIMLAEEQALENILKDITETEIRIKDASDQAEWSKEVEGIVGYIQEWEGLIDGIQSLESLLDEMEGTANIIDGAESQISDLTDEVIQLIQENKFCPLCGGDVDESAIDHVIEWL